MAGKKVEYEIGVDSSKGISGVKDFSRAVQSELKKVEDSFDDSAGAGEKVAAALKAIAVAADAELTEAAAAAEKLSVALGPELTARTDIGSVIADLNRMGLSFEEIAADADKLADALKEIDAVQVKGVESGLGKVHGGTDQIADSARGANSALANMIGNASQDLGAMTGIAGSAGVAIGQMAEYAADAALGGEKLGSALKSMALVAGPIAAITAAISVVSGIMGEISAEAEAAAARTKAVGDAMDDTATDAVGMAEVLKGSTDELRSLNVEASTFSGLVGQYLKTIVGGLPLISGVLADSGSDIVEILGDAELSMYDLARAGLVGSEGWKLFSDGAREALAAGKITEAQFEALLEAGFKYATATGEAAKEQKLFNVDLRAANELLDEMVAKKAPLEQYTDLWATLFADLRDGQFDTQASADAINYLSDELGISEQAVIDLARTELDKEMEANAAATEEAAAATEEARQKQEEYNAQLLETIRRQGEYRAEARKAQVAIGELADAFTQMGIRGDALSTVFDFGNAPLEALGAVHDVEEGIRDLHTFVDEEGVPDIFDPDDIDAGPFLDKIAGLRDPIQQKIVEAFEGGGPEAAKAAADSYIANLVDELGAHLTADQVEQLLGLGDLEAMIEVAIEQSTLENVRRQLEILTGIGGETPYTASITLALDAGAISAEAAEILVQAQLEGAGVFIPTALDTPDTTAAMKEAETFARENGIIIPLGVDATQAEKDIEHVARPRSVPITPYLVGGALDFIFGPSGGSPSAPSALAAAPMALGAPVAAPMAPAMAMPMALAIPAAKPVQSITQNIVVQAAVIGNPWDVANAVEDGVRRAARLNPASP